MNVYAAVPLQVYILLGSTWMQGCGVQQLQPRFGAYHMCCRAVSLAFMHDRSVPSHCSVEQHPSVSVISGPGQQETHQQAAPYPPNGCLTPQGSVLLAAPLCFMFDSPHAVYRLHRALYCRYVRLPSLLVCHLVCQRSSAMNVLLLTMAGCV
jgi:hypothetical protein